MSVKKIAVLASLTLVTLTTVAGFQADVENGDTLEANLSGGETNSLNGSFTHDSDFNDVQIELNVYSSKGMDGAEFYNFTGTAGGRTLECNNYTRINSSTLRYGCEAENVTQNDGIDFNIEFDTALNIAPGTYHIGVEAGPSLITTEETAEEKNTVVPNNGNAKVKTGNANVNINAEPNSTVTVRSFQPDDETVPKPSDKSEGVGAVTATASKNNTGGTISFEHDLDPDKWAMDVYYWDTSEAEWTKDPVSNVEVNETHVNADVDHFSTYAAYSEPAEEDTGGGGGGTVVSNESEPLTVDTGDDRTVEVGEEILFNATVSGADDPTFFWSFDDGESASDNPVSHTYSEAGEYNVVVSVTDEQDRQESDGVTVTVEEGEEEPGENETQPGEGQEEEGGLNETEEIGTDEESPKGPTGLFGGSPTDIMGVVVALLVLVLAYLERSGRTDLISKISSLRK